MRPLTAIVVEDERYPRLSLLQKLEDFRQEVEVVDSCDNYDAALQSILRHRPDILFLDIQLQGRDSIKLLDELAEIMPLPHIIFTTAYADRSYLMSVIKLSAVDYLLKPISYESFLHSASKALKRFETEHKAGADTTKNDGFIYVKSDYKLVRIFYDDILYIEGLKDYVQLHLSTPQKKVLCLMNMKTLEDNLPHPEFMRVHRSYIVHMPKADSIDRLRIVFGDNYIPISESYKDAVQKYINSHMLL